MNIPKRIYMGWEGENIPDWVTESFNMYKKLNPDFECIFYNDFDIIDPKFPLYKFKDCFKDMKFFKADIFRYYILNTYGGIWVDTDTLPFRPFDKYLLKQDSFIVKVRPRNVVKILVEGYILDNYLMGCKPNNSFISEIIKRFERKLKDGQPQSPYSLAMFRLFKNEEIDNYTTALDTSLTEESDLDDCKVFFSGKRYNLIKPFIKTSYLKHFRNNDYKLRLERKGINGQ